ncbi:hypothetical protein acdb102_44370 [Acidothermaceae bacterium B102]|nr:hypothetical protein acdb102_44370 [Acidothermaceae bacterium B102]
MPLFKNRAKESSAAPDLPLVSEGRALLEGKLFGVYNPTTGPVLLPEPGNVLLVAGLDGSLTALLPTATLFQVPTASLTFIGRRDVRPDSGSAPEVTLLEFGLVTEEGGTVHMAIGVPALTRGVTEGFLQHPTAQALIVPHLNAGPGWDRQKILPLIPV